MEGGGEREFFIAFIDIHLHFFASDTGKDEKNSTREDSHSTRYNDNHIGNTKLYIRIGSPPLT